MKYFFTLLFIIFLSAFIQPQQINSLKIATLNVWSGLDYEGTFKMGEYEPDSVRGRRFALLLSEIKKLKPDIIFLQEVNPAGSYSSRLADETGYDEIHQVCLAGLKFGPFGIPSNLKEGNAILARKELNMREQDFVKLSGSFGFFGDAFSMHFDESVFLLPAKITVNGSEILLINTHLYSPPDDEGIKRRTEEIHGIVDYLADNKDVPVIIGGDFNAVPESEEIKILKMQGNLKDVLEEDPEKSITWDPSKNSNIVYSTSALSEDPAALKDAEYDKRPRRVDYIFINNKINPASVKDARIVFDNPADGLFISDHYGVMTDIDVSGIPAKDNTVHPNWDALPIASYDTDFGFGAGLKAFLLNQFGYKESVDLTGYYSSKGERWYRFVFSVPDFEVRQQKVYPLAFDIIADYDKQNSNFFGIGNASKFEDQEVYFIEPVDIRLQFSRGLSPEVVLQGGLKFKYTRNMNFEEKSMLRQMGGLNASVTRSYGIFASLRYDTRNSFINPSRGVVLQGDIEYVPNLSISNSRFTGMGLAMQYYYKMFYPKTVLALRLLTQGRFGDNLPVQNFLSIGGNWNLRGYAASRLVDKVSAVFNAELRFPLVWRFGGIVGLDAGNVWHTPGQVSFKDWKMNPTGGLRFYFDTFVVRLDVGFSSESTGFYLNFGQLF